MEYAEADWIGMQEVSKKCPSINVCIRLNLAIYERAGSRIRTDDLLITNSEHF
jgi:hypothetical protein